MPNSERIRSIDALRGFIMLIMIFVNDLAIVRGEVVPNWMVHFHDRLKGSGMTFVDVVFPAFIFIVGMAIPFAIHSKHQIKHIMMRTLSLLLLGVMLANGWPSTEKMGFSAAIWETLMGLSAIVAFCYVSPYQKYYLLNHGLRVIGFAGLLILAVLFVGKNGGHILTLSPFKLYPAWWGILGILGFAYFIAAIIYLCFKTHRTALLGCMILLFCLFPAAQTPWLQACVLNQYINIGATLGVQPAIAVAGVLLSSILITDNTEAIQQRVRFAVLFILACWLAAYLISPLYAISKEQATPTWALWSLGITASLWLLFYLMCDVKPIHWLVKPLALAGNNVLLTYLLSAIYFSLLINMGLGTAYQNMAQMGIGYAVLRAFGMSVFLSYCTVKLNQIGFKVKL